MPAAKTRRPATSIAALAAALLVSACSSSGTPVPPASVPRATSGASSQFAQPEAAQTSTALAALPENGNAADFASIAPKSVSILPVVDVPAGKARQLSGALQSAAARNNLAVSGSGRADARLKGYFSTYNDGSNTVVVYVWDVLDASGAVRHRINGQQRIATVRGDPWANVPAQTLGTIADDTMAQLSNWLQTQG